VRERIRNSLVGVRAAVALYVTVGASAAFAAASSPAPVVVPPPPSAASPAAPAASPPAAARPPVGGPLSAADVAALARVERAVAALASVRAQFVQELVDPRTKAVQRAEGTLSLQKPGRFRWDYTTPKQLIVSDGTKLWLYDADLEQVTVRRVRDTLSQTPAMLLSGQSRIRDQFEVRDGGESDGLSWVRLLPKTQDTDFRELRLAFAGDTLRRMEFEDKLNQLTRITLNRVERNARLDASLFRFVPPPGVDVIGPAT
jgi:chaperone LolA